METPLRRIAKFVLFLLIPATFLACGGGGGGGAPASVPYTKISSDNPLYTVLSGENSQKENFPGIASFIDTKILFLGADMFLGLTIEDAAKALITKNINSFLETAAPVFDGNPSTSYNGVTVYPALKKITFKDSETTISWIFAGNSVERGYTKTYNAGDLTGSTYSSTWKYTYSPATGLTTVIINDLNNETDSSKKTKKIASYNGTVKYIRNSADSSLTSLTSADFSQKRTETNSSTALTWTLNGNVKMVNTSETGGTLAFDGEFSFDLPSYKTVTGVVTLTDGTYGKGYNSGSNYYYNETDISNGTLTLTSQTDYSSYIPATNALSLKGQWAGSFTDSCGVDPGDINLEFNNTPATWYGFSNVFRGENFVGQMFIDEKGLHLKNNGQLWGDSSSVSDTTITGTWSFKGCGGIFTVVKQP